MDLVLYISSLSGGCIAGYVAGLETPLGH